MTFDLGQTGAISALSAALVTVIRIAEKRYDRSRHGPLYPRVQHLQDRYYDLNLRIEDLEREDMPRKLKRMEESIRELRDAFR